MEKTYYVYIITNLMNTVLYTGVTNDISRRIDEHKAKCVNSFTKKYKLTKLVYVEIFTDVYSAISREKEIKGFTRARKERLIDAKNPNWDEIEI